MTKRLNKQLLRAVLEPRKNGALRTIAETCAAGADPNGICPETSTSTGHVRAGSTLLTHSIHACASNAVEQLLKSGADPNLADQNGWSPWMASTLVDDSKKAKIQRLLSQYDAVQDGEHIGKLARAIMSGDVHQATSFFESDQDLQILSTSRVDLVKHQLRDNPKMLELLLERNATPTSSHLTHAIRARSLTSVDLLLRYGVAPEHPTEIETPLMTAAAMNELGIVQRLVEAGADVNRYADENAEWTASFYARNAGNVKVANWLESRMKKLILEKQFRLVAARDPKFRKLYAHATAAEWMDTDEIADTLRRWDETYGLTITDAESDRVTVRFSKSPTSVDFYEELVKFCPGVCDNYEALLKEFKNAKTLVLWWD